jgi:putative transferase (TIGR04331 family)
LAGVTGLNMFLATTALEEFWNKNDELLFLGRWCIRNLDENRLRQLRYKILPNPWDNRRRLRESLVYLDNFNETVVARLSGYLDHVHGTDFGIRYWRVLAGPWLVQNLHVIFDRYTLLKDALNQYPQMQTMLLDPEFVFRPRDTLPFQLSCRDDDYNLYLFSSILRGMGHNFPCSGFEHRESADTTSASPVTRFALFMESAIAGRPA